MHTSSVKLPPLILASKSPRRQELLKRVGLDFSVCTSETDESHHEKDCPRDLVLRLSLEKGREVAFAHPGSLVISSDTVVAIDGIVLGKPRDEQGAIDMLKRLSGHTHHVYTGYAFQYRPEGCDTLLRVSKAQKTAVRFHELSDNEIEAYVSSGEPMDKAGAYGIQDLGALLVHSIQGDYFNVMGFPIAQAYRDLLKFAEEHQLCV